MRCNPIINWSYKDVWFFLRRFDIPYCQLYDLGYTSLGLTTNTTKNKNLLIDESNEVKNGTEYLPAYFLSDGSLERVGRT